MLGTYWFKKKKAGLMPCLSAEFRKGVAYFAASLVSSGFALFLASDPGAGLAIFAPERSYWEVP